MACIRLVQGSGLLGLTLHTLGFFGEDVPHFCWLVLHFSLGCKLEALLGPAVGFHFWHVAPYRFLVRSFLVPESETFVVHPSVEALSGYSGGRIENKFDIGKTDGAMVEKKGAGSF